MTTSTPKTSTTNPGVWPTLSYRDAEAAVRYLVDVVGFTESVVHRGDADRPISHAELLWPDGGGIMFGSEPKGERWSGETGGPGHSTIYLSTRRRGRPRRPGDRGRLDGAATAERDRLRQPRVRVPDPEGNAWSVGTYRGEQA